MSKSKAQIAQGLVKLEWLLIVVFLFAVLFGAGVMAADKLVVRAVLDAATFATGPTAETLLGTEPINRDSYSPHSATRK